MSNLVTFIGLCTLLGHVASHGHHNETVPDQANIQLEDFRRRHSGPIGVFTKVSGEPLDIRDTVTINSELFNHRNHFRLTDHNTKERTPERIIFAKGAGAFGYFELTHDISKFTKSDVFNGVGKKTPVMVRFSTEFQNLGGSDLVRERKGMSVKFYTREGNLDFVCSNIPIYAIKDPMHVPSFIHAFKRNPRTNMFDSTSRWDFITLKSNTLNTILWAASDYGFPDGYRKMDSFPIHTYIIYNSHGDKFFVKFSFKTETEKEFLTDARGKAIATTQPDYFHRDLYNAIANKNYPSWKLEMDILTEKDLMKVNYDPFDVTRLWKKGTYRTVPIGRLVLNRRVDNHFSDIERSAFSPDNLVPGIFGPIDAIYRARKIVYPDAHNYRLGSNYDKTAVNAPQFYNINSRDGVEPLQDNMRDAPVYFPNSFNGPMPFVDEDRPNNNIEVYQSKAVDLEPSAQFYNEIIDNDAHRQRIANVIGERLRTVPWDIEKKVLHLLTLVSEDLGKRVKKALSISRAVNIPARRNQTAQCVANVNKLHNHYGINRHMSYYD